MVQSQQSFRTQEFREEEDLIQVEVLSKLDNIGK